MLIGKAGTGKQNQLVNLREDQTKLNHGLPSKWMLIVLALFVCYLYTITVAAIVLIYITTSFEYVRHNLYVCHLVQ